ncbi:MAG: molybdopterin molybdotransferase MoeA [Micrococcales bacterium]|nr:molybdopterin molybdotransferase MoeA [Micrococcales bacterium]
MRSVQDHLAAVLATVAPVRPLDVALRDTAGCVLAADVVAAADVPPFAVADCDGYAVAATDTLVPGTGTLPVAHDVRPGTGQPPRLVSGQAIRVSAGAPMPPGANAVVPVEQTDRADVMVTVPHDVAPGTHVRPAGHDARGGTVVLAAGTRLCARQLSLAAAIGRSRLWVHPAPRVVLLAVGDELVEPGTRAQPGQVYESNRFAMEAAVRDAGCTPIRVPIVGDDRARLRETIEDQLVRADVVVVTGGLSELVDDTVKDVLPLLGDVRIDRVAMTPGGRQGLGVLGEITGIDREVPVFALPGDPVAALTAFEVFVRPALCTMAGLDTIHRPSVPAGVSRGWRSPEGLRQFVPATLVGDPETGYEATVLGDPFRPSLADVACADAFVVVSEAELVVNPGRVLQAMVLR